MMAVKLFRDERDSIRVRSAREIDDRIDAVAGRVSDGSESGPREHAAGESRRCPNSGDDALRARFAQVLSLGFRRARRFFPGWEATLVDLPTEALISEQRSRQIEGLWLREPKQFLHDALPRAHAFLDRFGDLRGQITACWIQAV